MRDLTIVIPYYNGRQYIENLLNTIPENQKTIIVDDISDEPYQSNRSNVTVYRLAKKGGFTGACNFGIEQCDTDVLILNQDTLLSNGWQNVIQKNHDKYALIGERIKGNHPLFHNGYIHGTFFFIRRDVINDIGLMNEKLYPLWGSTAEFQLRASRNGYKVLPLAQIPQFSHLRGNREAYGSSIKHLLKKHPEAKKQLINTPPEISVIIPCHNYAHYLQDSVNSLIGGETCLGKMAGQTMQSFEVIIVDDGSNKENQKAINKFVDGWNGIRVIRLNRNPIDENGKYTGKPSALNAGINKAIGKYITVLDADDMMDSRRLETLYRIAEQNPNKVIYDQILSFKTAGKRVRWFNENNNNRVLKIDTTGLSLGQETTRISKMACENSKKTVYGNNLAFYFWTLPEYDFDTILHKNCMHSGIFFTKKMWADVGGYNERMIYGREDWCINIALGEKGYCGLKTEQPFYLYRREGQNRTLENTKPDWQNYFKQQLQEIYLHLYRGERTMACCGRGARKQAVQNNNNNLKSLMNLKQQDGLTYVKYVGNRSASFSTWGSSTGVQYRVNPKNPVFLVDDNDLYSIGNKTGILDIYEGNTHVFNVYDPPKKEVKKEPVIVEEVKPVESFDALQDDNEDEFELTETHLEALSTVSNLKDFMLNKTFSLVELEAMLAYEAENKNRVSAKNMIERNIDEYDGSTLVMSSDIQNY